MRQLMLLRSLALAALFTVQLADALVSRKSRIILRQPG